MQAAAFEQALRGRQASPAEMTAAAELAAVRAMSPAEEEAASVKAMSPAETAAVVKAVMTAIPVEPGAAAGPPVPLLFPVEAASDLLKLLAEVQKKR